MLNKSKAQTVDARTQDQAEIGDAQLDALAGGTDIGKMAETAPVERDSPRPVLMVIAIQDF